MAASRVPRILFLIADTGGGHRSAANAIRAAMDVIAPEADLPTIPASHSSITASELPFAPSGYLPAAWSGALRPWHADIHDIFQECGRSPIRQTMRLYGPTVTNSPTLYAGFYYATNTPPIFAALSALNKSLIRRGLVEALPRWRPDLIVSVHPLLTQPTLEIVKRVFGAKIPAITVVTDLVRFHRAWAMPDVDLCIVPTLAAQDLMVQMGMPANKIRLIGMPIHPKFCLPSAGRATTLQALGLDPDRFTVLLVGGGDGVGTLGESARAIAASGLPIQQIVVTGRNRRLRDELLAEQATFGAPSVILGFVENMPDLMRAADIIVTKAGPGTIAEALACGLPIILTGAIPGQEVGNIEYVESQGVGQLARTPEAIVEALQGYVTSDPTAYAALRDNARQLSKPRASFEIANLILGYVPSTRSISVWDRVAPRAHHRRRSVRRTRQRYPRPKRPVAPSSGMEQLRRLPLLIRRRQRRLSLRGSAE